MVEDQRKAIELITQALDKANQRGVFNLAESSSVIGALKTVSLLIGKEDVGDKEKE